MRQRKCDCPLGTRQIQFPPPPPKESVVLMKHKEKREEHFEIPTER